MKRAGRKCASKTRAGRKCRRAALPGKARCAMHVEGGAQALAAMRSTARKAKLPPIPPVDLSNLEGVRAVAERVVAELAAYPHGQQAGYQIASLLQVAMKCIELERAQNPPKPREGEPDEGEWKPEPLRMVGAE